MPTKKPKAFTLSATNTLKGKAGIKHSSNTNKKPNGKPPIEINLVLYSIM